MVTEHSEGERQDTSESEPNLLRGVLRVAVGTVLLW